MSENKANGCLALNMLIKEKDIHDSEIRFLTDSGQDEYI